MASFYVHLKQWREERGLTQKELSEHSGIPRPNLVALEQGRRECTVSTLRRLAHALSLSAGELLDKLPKRKIQRDLSRHETDKIARKMMGQAIRLPVVLETIFNQAMIEAKPLLRAAHIRTDSKRLKKRIVAGDKPLVHQVLQRLPKLL